VAVRAVRYPNTTLVAGGTYGRDPITDEILELGGHRPASTWVFDTILDVSYEVDLFGHVRRSIEASRADAAADAAARDAIKITVAAETARAYAQVCALGEQLSVAHHSLEVVTREDEITIQRHQAGASSLFDVARAQGLVAQVRAGIPPLEGQRKAALFELATLLGRAPSRAPMEAQACVRPPQLDALIPVGDGVELLRRRPDVRQAERRVAAATARVGVATADLYPRISLTGFFGGVSATLPARAALAETDQLHTSTLRPGTFEKCLRLFVTTVIPWETACEAMRRSILPIGLPARSNSERIFA
jgi:outer membrane protein TolC